MQVVDKSSTPPSILLYGTSEETLDLIKYNGTQTESWLHRFTQLFEVKSKEGAIESAKLEAKKWTNKRLAISEIDTEKALEGGSIFYAKSDGAWLVEKVRPRCIIWGSIQFIEE